MSTALGRNVQALPYSMALKVALGAVICGLFLSLWLSSPVAGAEELKRVDNRAVSEGTAPVRNGVAAKRPVLGAACPICPYGSTAKIVKAALDQYGYDVQICHNCGGAERAVALVAAAATPEPPGPPGTIDFGVSAAQYVWWAYQGSHQFAKGQGAQRQLRLLAYIQSPSYLLVAASAETGITDLGQIRDKKMAVRIVAMTTSGIDDVLEHYGLSEQAVKSWGGELLRGSSAANRGRVDVIIGFGALNNTPEHNIWYQQSQRQNLTFLELPGDLIARIVDNYDLEANRVPEALLRGVDRPFPTVVRSGIAIYSRSDLPEEFAYTVAKAIDQHQDLLQWSHMNVSYNANTAWRAYRVPLHPGAERYYRERGYLKR